MDVIKERLQIEGQVNTLKEYGGSMNAFLNIVKYEGIRGLYRAYWMHQLTWAPFNGLYFSIYEQLKKYLILHPILSSTTPSNKTISTIENSDNNVIKKKLPIIEKLICAVTAGTVASAVTSPIDLVKTRLQVQRSNPDIFDYKV